METPNELDFSALAESDAAEAAANGMVDTVSDFERGVNQGFMDVVEEIRERRAS